MGRRLGGTLVVLATMGAVACSGGDPDTAAPTSAGPASTGSSAATSTESSAPPTSSSGAPTSTAVVSSAPTTAAAPPSTAPSAPIDPAAIVEMLASDELAGRQNLTDGSGQAQAVIIDVLSTFAEPWNSAVPASQGYFQPFTEGTNLFAILPGTDLADEYVVVGAHYDHLGVGDCRGASAADDICNGAADNAAGVAAVLAIGAAIAADEPRRSVVLAFWDAEEDGLVGSRASIGQMVVPLDQIVTYVNFDIQGAALLPSIADRTIVVGAETGGVALTALVDEVTSRSNLRYSQFSLIMGQGRSDHAPFAAAGVPVVFFTDSTNGCYHSVDDEVATVDFGKLAEQISTSTDLVVRLANDDAAIEFADDAPLTTFADAEQLLDIARAGEADLAAVDPVVAATAADVIAALDGVVTAGPGAYDADAEGTALGAAAQLVELLTAVDCAFATS